MFLLGAQNSFCIILSSYVEEHVKKMKSEFHVFGWLPGLQNLDLYLQIYCVASFEIIFREK